jgi:hypothetical protein
MANPVNNEKLTNIDLTLLSLAYFLWMGWRWTHLLGLLLLCFRFIPLNPTFITSYDLGKEVWVVSDLLLKLHAALQLMLLLIITQQPWHKFCSNLSHVQFIHQNTLAMSIWQFHNVSNIMDHSPVALGTAWCNTCMILLCQEAQDESWDRNFVSCESLATLRCYGMREHYKCVPTLIGREIR